jgi:hypothetical protein
MEDSSVGLGDVSLDLGYEILPETTYSAWRPKGFIFSRLKMPTGKSIYEGSSPLGSDVTGRGFTSLAVGTAWFKTFGIFDVLLSGEGHYSFSRTFSVAALGTEATFSGAWGFSAILAAGISPGAGNLRFGLGLSPVWESSRSVSAPGIPLPDLGARLSWDCSAQVSYLWSSEWSTTFTYVDQTLMGPAYHTTLSRTFALLVQKRWEL